MNDFLGYYKNKECNIPSRIPIITLSCYFGIGIVLSGLKDVRT